MDPFGKSKLTRRDDKTHEEDDDVPSPRRRSYDFNPQPKPRAGGSGGPPFTPKPRAGGSGAPPPPPTADPDTKSGDIKTPQDIQWKQLRMDKSNYLSGAANYDG